jgi:hypothetical protein
MPYNNFSRFLKSRYHSSTYGFYFRFVGALGRSPPSLHLKSDPAFTEPESSLPYSPILSQMNPVHILPFYFLQIHFNIMLSFTTKFAKWLFPSRLSTHILSLLSSLPCVLHDPPSVDHPNSIRWRVCIYILSAAPSSHRGTSWTAGVRVSAETRCFSLLHSVHTGSGAQLTPYPMGTGVKPQGRDVEQSVPFNGDVKNGGTILPLPHTSSWRSN